MRGAFILFLANAAHAKGLGIGLKNAIEVLQDRIYGPQVIEAIGFAVNEECIAQEGCSDGYSVLAGSGNKPILNIEYPEDANTNPAERAWASTESASRCSQYKAFPSSLQAVMAVNPKDFTAVDYRVAVCTAASEGATFSNQKNY
jgi:hypothetical protein